MERPVNEPQLATYLHARGKRLGLPISGTFELTGRCNFRCPMCYVHDQSAQDLSARQWISLAQDARDAGMVFALLTGGEPFLRKDFFEIYSAMKAMGLLISINSNGSLLSGEIRERLLADPPYRMQISLYGGCRETYRTLCGQDAFTQVVENLRALRQGGIQVRLNLSITPYNRHDLQEIWDISRELGVHVKATGYLYPPVRLAGSCDHRLEPAEAGKIMVEWDRLRLTKEEFARRAQTLQLLELRECPVELEPGVGCRAGSSSFWLTWDGRMTPCGMMPQPAAKPLEIGFSAAWQQIRRQTQTIRTPSGCAACPKRQLCAVCAAVCLTETGRFDAVPDYMCAMTDAILEAYREE